jgi:hypothetical protein
VKEKAASKVVGRSVDTGSERARSAFLS